jgi:hypothetical protein
MVELEQCSDFIKVTVGDNGSHVDRFDSSEILTASMGLNF